MKRLRKPTVWIPVVALLFYVLLVLICPVFVVNEQKVFLNDNKMFSDGLWYGFGPDFSFLSEMPASAPKFLFQGVIGFWHSLLGLDVIDARFLSIIYVVLTAFALWLIARNINLRTSLANTIAGVLIVLFATSYGYFSYFNTFYREGLVLPLILLIAGGLLQFSKSKSVWAFLLFFVAAGSFVTLGVVPALLVVFLAVAGFRLAFMPMQRWKQAAALVLSVLLFPLSWLGFSSTSVSDYKSDLYNAVFYGALMETEDAASALREMGLSDDLVSYAKTPYFNVTEADKETLNKVFYPNFGYKDLAAYYLKHPNIFFAVVKQAGNNVYEADIRYLRSYDASVASPQRYLSMPTHWFETLQLRFLPRGVISWLVYLLLFIILACVRRKTLEGDGEKAKSDCAVVFAFMPLLLLLATPFVSGLTEISRRLFYTNAVFECFFVILVAYAAEIILLRRNRLKEQYGVNQ